VLMIVIALVIDYRSSLVIVLASHGTSNVLNEPSSDGRVRISLGSYLDHSGAGYDTCAGWCRGNAAGAEAPPDLLGARNLDCEPFYLSRRSVVDFLLLSQPAIVELLSFRLCSLIAHDYLSHF